MLIPVEPPTHYPPDDESTLHPPACCETVGQPLMRCDASVKFELPVYAEAGMLRPPHSQHLAFCTLVQACGDVLRIASIQCTHTLRQL
jgi:hypothetical protein